MKGIIVDYFIERGFGFIKDENEDKLFFHVNNIKQKGKFLDNIGDYFYNDDEDFECFVVDFVPKKSEKGLIAIDINLTNQVFNDRTICLDFDAKITDVKYKVHSLTRIVSGISKGKETPFGATAGGNGTYRLGYPEVFKELNLFYRRLDDIGWGQIDIRKDVLSIYRRSKITDAFVAMLEHKLIGKTVNLQQTKNGVIIKDLSILK